jgi:hypothetical protein
LYSIFVSLVASFFSSLSSLYFFFIPSLLSFCTIFYFLRVQYPLKSICFCLIFSPFL